MVKIASNGGIGNRLRTMIGYASAYRLMNKPLPVFIWKNTKHAPPNHGAFTIDGTDIIDVEDIDGETVMVPGTIDVALMHRTHDLPSPGLRTVVEAFGMIGFSREIEEACTEVFDVAVHLRMTDMASENRFQAFRQWLIEHCRGCRIYLACDEPSTVLRLGKELNVVNYTHFREIEGSLRKTTTREAAVDVLTCVHARRFVGTRVSSFSHLIKNIRIHRRKRDDGHLLI